MFSQFRILLATVLLSTVSVTVYFIVYYDHLVLRNMPQLAQPLNPLDELPIYVLSLPHRADRRDEMEVLRKTLGLAWSYVDATSATDSLVQDIQEQLYQIRALSDTSFKWPDEDNSRDRNVTEQSLSGTAKATQTGEDEREPLTCATQDYTVVPYELSMPEHMLLTPTRIACWHSHTSLIAQLARNGSAAIILEDDVDMERDIKERIDALWDSLPGNWDMVFFGHCWSDESIHSPLPLRSKKYSMTRIHPSNAPRCTHAYAVSSSGAKTITRHVNYPPFAYSRAIDQAFAWLVQSGRLKAYSVVPSVIIQRKIGLSDISLAGGEWRDELVHGVFPDEHDALYI